MRGLQEWIYQLEVGRGTHLIRAIAACLMFIGVAVVYDIRCYKNFSEPEAMDVSQIGRSLAQGKGYTTQFIRPLSLHLLQERKDKAFLKQPQPDIANPPAYPFVLSGLMRLLPFNFEIVELSHRSFLTYSPEVWIAIFNQFLFLVTILLTFFIARYLFDAPIAWVASIITGGTEVLWHFTISGLSTLFLMAVFMAFISCLVLLEKAMAEENPSLWRILGLGSLLAAGLAAAALTRYSFAWLLLPVILFLVLYGSVYRGRLIAIVLVVFIGLLSPWLIRNHQLSGNPFGIAGYAIAQGTTAFPDDQPELERTLDPRPRLKKLEVADYMRKLLVNTRDIIQEPLPRLGGNWISAFFLAGLLMPFKSRTLSRIRVFLICSIVVLVVAQALGRTRLSSKGLPVTGDNLLVVLAPLIFIYGTGFYFILLDQLSFPHLQFKHAVTAVFCVVLSAPLLFALMPPRSSPISYPPYWPPSLQEVSKLMKEKELMMSDMPWAIAWYGQRQCCWLTVNPHSEFFKINDELKPVQGLYLTALTMDQKFLTAIARDQQSWGKFVRDLFVKGEAPPGFPLRKSPGLSDRLFLTDWERWKVSESSP